MTQSASPPHDQVADLAHQIVHLLGPDPLRTAQVLLRHLAHCLATAADWTHPEYEDEGPFQPTPRYRMYDLLDDGAEALEERLHEMPRDHANALTGELALAVTLLAARYPNRTAAAPPSHASVHSSAASARPRSR